MRKHHHLKYFKFTYISVNDTIGRYAVWNSVRITAHWLKIKAQKWDEANLKTSLPK